MRGHVAAGVDTAERRFESLRVHSDVASVGKLRRLFAEEIQNRMLTNGENQRVEGNLEFAPGDLVGNLPTTRVAVAPIFHPSADQPGELAALDVKRMGLGHLDDLDAFFDGAADLLPIGGHLINGAAVDERHLGAQTVGRAHAVHRRIAGADDTHPPADRYGMLLPDATQKE